MKLISALVLHLPVVGSTSSGLLGAIRAVSEGLGMNRAALEFRLPATTLKDRISGKVHHGCKAGKTPYLTQSEEKELYDYLVTYAKIGYPKRRDDVIGIVRKTLEHKARNIEFKGDGWYNRFMERWPRLSFARLIVLRRTAGATAPSTGYTMHHP